VEARRKGLLAALVVLCLIAAARIGSTFYQMRAAETKAQIAAAEAAARTSEQRFHPSSEVLELLNRTDAPPPRFDGGFPCVFAPVTGAEVLPQLGTCAMPEKPAGPVDRFEVDLRYGHFVLRQSDLYISDVFEVPLTRTYNSGDYVSPNRVHAFGKNTNHPYDIAPLGTRFPYTYNFIALEDGDYFFFPRVSAGGGFADAIYQHTETSTRFYKAVTAWNGDGWTTWLTDGSAIRFPEAYNSTNMAQGAAVEMRDAEGNRLKLLRDGQRNLLEIRTPNQHSIKFKYDELSRVTRAQDDQGNWSQYRYSGDGMLVDAAFSSGHARHYSYDGLLMTQIEDENRKVLLRNSYQNGLLIRQDFGGGKIYSYSYTPSQSRTYFERATVTLPDNSVATVAPSDSVPEHVKNPPH
jgi:YD repeat-containing protein